jgi:hypothetical protein
MACPISEHVNWVENGHCMQANTAATATLVLIALVLEPCHPCQGPGECHREATNFWRILLARSHKTSATDEASRKQAWNCPNSGCTEALIEPQPGDSEGKCPKSGLFDRPMVIDRHKAALPIDVVPTYLNQLRLSNIEDLQGYETIAMDRSYIGRSPPGGLG